MKRNFWTRSLGLWACFLCLPHAGHAASCGMMPEGINFSGAEFGSVMPGRPGIDYKYSANQEYAEAAASGFKIIRLPFRWERVQPVLNGPLDPANLAQIDNAVSQSAAHGMDIILDMHNSAMRDKQSMSGNPQLTNAYYNFWQQMARRYAGKKNVRFDLMNEPVHIKANEWAGVMQKTIDLVRQAGFNGPLLVMGINYSGVHNWFLKGNDVSNADALATLNDPAHNLAIEMHQYFDADSSGTHAQCQVMDPQAVFGPVSDWLRRHGFKAFLGEYGGSTDKNCLASIDAVLGYIDQNKDVWTGAAYWGGGGSWGKTYPYALDFGNGVGAPQLQAIRKHICGSNGPTG